MMMMMRRTSDEDRANGRSSGDDSSVMRQNLLIHVECNDGMDEYNGIVIFSRATL